ncbi:glycerate kinase [Shewanella sp. NIFS-20-20]|uniref:glycerate kinase n=1 Tax=Shewanella sp. NIFS-20-20 TaxID=2853806 RepID=UPI001C48C7D7|nr:glycerate kinase [Shewanella sp. NIFS-20-20]MBV7316576.1 glycerate kinase [Shewanella sp. NIFS-20-20]
MKIVIAPDSFKESLSALEVANAIEIGFKQVFPEADYIKVPMADGGEGTVDAMVDATAGSRRQVEVTGPIGERIMATYGLLGQNEQHSAPRAIIEMASASGIHLVPMASRNPYITSSIGTGELIKDALDHGVRHIILGLGGSATNDGGAGMLQALGAILLDQHQRPLSAGGAALSQLVSVDVSNLHPALADCQIDVACDVDNPLCGERGASYIFGPQKGASPAMVEKLDKALAHFAAVVASQYPATQGLAQLAGAGAAGGMGFAVVSLLGAKLAPGVDLVKRAVNLEHAIAGASLVITGEGRIDGQTVYGKTPMGVLNVANDYKVPCIALAGCLGSDADKIKAQGMQAIFPIVPASVTLEQALATGEQNLIRTAANLAAIIKLGQRFGN